MSLHLLSLDPGHEPQGRARGENPKDEVGGRYCTRGQEDSVLALTQHLLCDLGQVISLLWASVCPCVKSGLEISSLRGLFPHCSLWGTGGGACLPPPLSPTQACRGAGRVGWSHWGEPPRQGCWLVSLPTLGQSLVCLFPALCGFMALEAESQDNCWGLRSPPQPPREGVSRHRREGLRGLSWDGSSCSSPAGSARAAGGRW